MTNETTIHPEPTIREDILELVHPLLVNAKAFEQDLKEMPHRKFFSEKAIIYYCKSDNPESNDTLRVGKWLNDVTDISEEELYQAAVRNVADKWMCIDFAELGLTLGKTREMAVLTFKGGDPLGAAAILSKDALKQMSSILEGDFYALPSSIHEFICVRADTDADPADLKKLTGAANRYGIDDYISEYEILGEVPLFYDAQAGVLKEVES